MIRQLAPVVFRSPSLLVSLNKKIIEFYTHNMVQRRACNNKFFSTDIKRISTLASMTLHYVNNSSET